MKPIFALRVATAFCAAPTQSLSNHDEPWKFHMSLASLPGGSGRDALEKPRNTLFEDIQYLETFSSMSISVGIGGPNITASASQRIESGAVAFWETSTGLRASTLMKSCWFW